MDELRAILGCAKQLQTDLQGLVDWLYSNVVGDDVLPRSLPEELNPLIHSIAECVKNIDASAGSAFERYSGGPCGLSLSGYKPSEDQYYILAAMGAWRDVAHGLGLSPLTEFEVFSMLHYEDDHRRGYINSEEKPPVHGIARMRLGIPPEEVSKAALRSEQCQFFKQYLPAVYDRFAE
jgi:hypothetical protein